MKAVVGSIVALNLILACSNAEMVGNTGRKGPVAPPLTPTVPRTDNNEIPMGPDQVRELTLGCDTEKNLAGYDLVGPADTKLRIKGKFCPHTTGQLTVLFVIDFSGSMAQADPSGLGGCGRLSAAAAIVAKFRGDVVRGDDVKIGLVTFGRDASLDVPLTPIDEFQKALTSDFFCRSHRGNTNYKAAFERTATTLATAQGSKVMYFESDGMPTWGGAGGGDGATDPTGAHAAAGQEAFSAMKQQVSGLTSNFVFLSSRAQAGERQYLESLAGDPERVKVAAKSSELAEKIVELAMPKLVIDPNSAAASLRSPGAAPGAISLEKFAPSVESLDIWDYVTAPFQPRGTQGSMVINTFEISAADTKTNARYQETVVVRFSAQ